MDKVILSEVTIKRLQEISGISKLITENELTELQAMIENADHMRKVTMLASELIKNIEIDITLKSHYMRILDELYKMNYHLGRNLDKLEHEIWTIEQQNKQQAPQQPTKTSTHF